ncbi:hypothetical protein [Streptomyces sp. NPDC018000]
MASSLNGAEKQQGAYGPAKEMANEIVATQTTQITQMRTMLASSTP